MEVTGDQGVFVFEPEPVRSLVRRSPLINPCGTETEALAKADVLVTTKNQSNAQGGKSKNPKI